MEEKNILVNRGIPMTPSKGGGFTTSNVRLDDPGYDLIRFKQEAAFFRIQQRAMQRQAEAARAKAQAVQAAIDAREREAAAIIAAEVSRRDAEEAARQLARYHAEEAARQIAQQQAEEAARQLAQQQAEKAARQLMQQQAEEAARQLAQQQAEEAARQIAQQQTEDAARQAILLSESETKLAAKLPELETTEIDDPEYVKHASDAGRLWSAIAGPHSPTQEIPKGWERVSDIAKHIFLRKAAATLGRQLPILAAFYPSELESGERPADILTTSASDLVAPGVDLDYIATKNGTIEVSHRLVPDADAQDGWLKWIVADGVDIGSKVRVRPVTYDSTKNTYNFTRDGDTTPTLTWTPQIRPENSSTHLPAAPRPEQSYEGSDWGISLPEIYIFPQHVQEPDDYILVLPTELGGISQYVYFKSPRQTPGIASGEGKFVSGTWLGENTRNEGAPIPSQIADKLRGRKFSDFDKMREAIWRAVASDEELGRQFSKQNLELMKQGEAPYPRLTDQAGGRNKFEVHHIHEISAGGEVYDVSNLAIMTPRQHIDHHKGQKQ